MEQVLDILQSVNAFDYTRKQAQKSADLAKKSLKIQMNFLDNKTTISYYFGPMLEYMLAREYSF
jgi:hypothetical protein